MWQYGGQTPMGAFDDAEDFTLNDVIAMAGRRSRPFGRAKVWIDVGTSDPFYSADTMLTGVLRAHGQKVIYHSWPGGHSGGYWNAHAGQYMRFYANALAHC
jgi:enterochelin esterase-like enzyme